MESDDNVNDNVNGNDNVNDNDNGKNRLHFIGPMSFTECKFVFFPLKAK